MYKIIYIKVQLKKHFLLEMLINCEFWNKLSVLNRVCRYKKNTLHGKTNKFIDNTSYYNET